MEPRPNLARRAAAEALGAFALVFAGCGAIVTEAEHPGELGTVGIALVFGLVIMAMVYATGHLSGAHLNPAVTLAFTLTRHLPAREALAYIGAQLLGALAAAALLLAIWPSEPAALGTTLPSVGAGSAFAYEAILTAFLMFTIMAVATDTRAVGAGAAIAIGGVVGLDALFGGPITGASMNPARSLAPALVSGNLDDLWIYLTAPLLGAAAGALAYQAVRGETAGRRPSNVRDMDVSGSSAPGEPG
jgi:aquaporin NIP